MGNTIIKPFGGLPMINVRGLKKTYVSDEGRIAAIDGVDLDIRRG